MIEKIEVDVANKGHITNCYLVYDEHQEGIVIDPGYDSQKIITRIVLLGISIKYICITHTHADHIGALQEIQQYTKAPVMIHEAEYNALINKAENYHQMLGVTKQILPMDDIITVKDGHQFVVGSLTYEVIHTPGHTAGCICFWEEQEKILLTGDTVFSDGYGRCDLDSGSFEEMVASLQKLFERFHEVTIYPGHGHSVRLDKAKRYIRMLMALKGITL